MMTIEALKRLPPLSENPYNGIPGVGNPSEMLINSILAGKHWSEVDENSLVQEVADDLVLIKARDVTLLLPRALLILVSELTSNWKLGMVFWSSLEFELGRWLVNPEREEINELYAVYTSSQRRELSSLCRVVSKGFKSLRRDSEMMIYKSFSEAIWLSSGAPL